MSAAEGVAVDNDHALFLDTVRSVAARAVAPTAASIDAEDRIPDQVLAAAEEAGLLDLVATADAASAELVLLSASSVQRLAQASAAVAVRIAAAHVVGAAASRSTDPAAAATRIATVGGPVAVAVVDGRRALRVIPSRTGAGLLLDGVIDAAIGARDAAALLLFVNAAGENPQALLVRTDTTGVQIEAGPARSGLRGAGLARVTLSHLPVDQADRIGGAASVAAAAVHTDLMLGAAAAGIALGAIDQARQYMLQRHQFGKKIAEFGALRAMIGAMAADADAGWALVEAAARQPVPWGGAAPVLAARAVAVAAPTAVRVSIDALQLHGGYGYVTEFPVERQVRDAVSLRARVAGGVQSRLARSADAVLGQPAAGTASSTAEQWQPGPAERSA